MAGSVIYLASPIDHASASGIAHLRGQARDRLAESGVAVFDPAAAYLGAFDDPVAVRNINNAALDQSSGILALVPSGVTTIGVPMELQQALDRGKWIAVVGGAWSLNLQSQRKLRRWDTFTPESLEEAVGWLCGQVAPPEAGEPAGGQGTNGAGRIMLWFAQGEAGQDVEPRQGRAGDAGFDLTVTDTQHIRPGEFADVQSGISVALPPDCWAMVTGRSSTLRRRGLLVHTGIIDSGYRGPLFAGVWNLGEKVATIEAGERIAQLIPMPLVAETVAVRQVVAAEDLGTTERGTAGFGSTGA